MILAVDIGNSHIVLGCMDGTNVLSVKRIATVFSRTEFEYSVAIRQVLELDNVDCSAFEGAIISSVVPPLTGIIRDAVKILTGQNAMIVGAGLKTGLDIRIDDPSQLGSDLAVGAVAALNLYKPPLIVIDMDTATSMTVINEKGQLIGGVIMPGLNLSMNSLVSGTSQLPRVSIEAPERCIGKNTVECMKSGAVFGTAAAIDGMIERIECELGCAASIIATGSLAPYVTAHCKREILCDGDLLLKGLALIYKKNRKSK